MNTWRVKNICMKNVLGKKVARKKAGAAILISDITDLK